MKKYSGFHDGYSQATMKFVGELETVIKFYEDNMEEASKEDILTGIKDRINEHLLVNIANSGVRMTENTDRVWLKDSELVDDKVKEELRKYMMKR
jgi:hypothetical protein